MSRAGRPARTRGGLVRTALSAAIAASVSMQVPLAQAQQAPPATAPSGVTSVDPAAPEPPAAPAPAAAEPAPLPPPAAPPPTVVLVAPAPPPSPPTVAVISTPAPPAPATPAWSPVFTGTVFARYEARAGYDDLGLSSATARQRFLEGDAIFYRVRFGIGTGLFEIGPDMKVGLQFTPQTTGTFGNLTNSPNAPNTIVDAALGLHEGYGRVQGKHTRLDVGRFELNYGDALVIGNLDWNEVGRSFDGVRARIASPSNAWLDLFATLIDEGRPDIPRTSSTQEQSPGIGLGDIYFLGAYAAFGPSIAEGLELDVYALVRTWTDAKIRLAPANVMSALYRRENAAEATLGVRAKQKLGPFDYRLEAGLQAGSRPGPVNTMAMPPPTKVESVDALAGHADFEIGVSAKDKFRVGLEGIYASGDDPSTTDKNEGWDELFPTAHKFLGLSDAFVQTGSKRTNVASGVLHLTLSPVKALTLQVDGHMFSRLEKTGPNAQDGYAASEVDIGAVLVLAKGLKLRGTYAVFIPDSDMYRDGIPASAAAKDPDPVHFAELELRYDLMP